MTEPAELADLVGAIRQAAAIADRSLVVGIDGASGSGKSTLAAAIARELTGQVAIVEGDDFYSDIDWSSRADFSPAEAYAHNYDWQRLSDQVLAPARAGQTVLRYQRYDWDHERIGDWIELRRPPVLVVEGVYTLRPELRDLIDLGIYVEADRELRIARQHARHATYDSAISARQNAMIGSWEAAELLYAQTYDPRAVAAFRISGVHPAGL